MRVSLRGTRRRSLLVTGVIAAAAAAALSATLGNAATERKAGAAATPQIIVVSGPDFDPFFGALKKGVTDASRQLGVSVQYTSVVNAQNLQADLARLLDQAVARHPKAIVLGNFFPSANEHGIKQAVAKGIPLIVHNSGQAEALALGALVAIGEDAVKMGAAAGQASAKAGVKHGLCVIHVPGNPNLEARCKGYAAALKQAGGTSKVITIPVSATDPDRVAAIKGALAADPNIDGVFTLGSAISIDALTAVEQSGSKAKIATTDLSNANLTALQQGKMLAVIDQQPYLQGFYSVMVATHYIRYGLLPSANILTGPLVITTANVAQVLKVNKQYGGIRGAA